MAVDMLSLKVFKASATNSLILNGLVPDEMDRRADEAAGERQLGRFVLPPFQRPAAWDEARKVRLIESVWLGLPIPPYVYNECHDGGEPNTDLWLIDGQQRWGAIYGYVAGDFEVFGSRYPDLSVRERREFRHTPFPAMTMRSNDVGLLRDIYHRLAYGGVSHEPADVAFPGP